MDVDLAHLHFHLFVFVLRYGELVLVVLRWQQIEVMSALCVWQVWYGGFPCRVHVAYGFRASLEAAAVSYAYGMSAAQQRRPRLAHHFAVQFSLG